VPVFLSVENKIMKKKAVKELIDDLWNAIECESKKIDALRRRMDRKDVELLSSRIAILEGKNDK
jgi:hypothetical protein